MIDYRRILEEESEPDFAAFTRKLNPGKEGIIGVRIPKIRALAKEIIKDDWRVYLEDEPGNFEEEMLRGLVIATAPMDFTERIALTDGFLRYVDNWATCDTFCTSWKFRKKESDQVYGYFASLMDTGEEFAMRVSLVSRMDHFLDEGHIDDIIDDLITYRNEGFYYKMGAAWVASFCYIKFPERTERILGTGDLEPWVNNKAIQKICESYRVSDEAKARVRSLKIA